MENMIKARLEESLQMKQRMLNENVNQLKTISKVILNAYNKGGKMILCGCGGSAADAQHIAAEMVGRFYKERPGLPAIALTTNTSILTAIANDYDFDKIFSRQVEALANPNDVVIGISTSGNSPVILNALDKAKEKGVVTIGFTGLNGGKLKEHADYILQIPSNNTPRIQEGHITAGHIICEILENELTKSD